MLIARLDPKHESHEQVRRWLEIRSYSGWATCPLTENGAVRIISNPAYSTPVPAAVVMERLEALCETRGHQFWPDDIRLTASKHIDAAQVQRSGQITDTYLLALAVAHGGKLATLDRRLVVAAVRGGAEALEVIRPE